MAAALVAIAAPVALSATAFGIQNWLSTQLSFLFCHLMWNYHSPGRNDTVLTPGQNVFLLSPESPLAYWDDAKERQKISTHFKFNIFLLCPLAYQNEQMGTTRELLKIWLEYSPFASFCILKRANGHNRTTLNISTCIFSFESVSFCILKRFKRRERKIEIIFKRWMLDIFFLSPLAYQNEQKETKEKFRRPILCCQSWLLFDLTTLLKSINLFKLITSD